jgi:hypothetical protein
MQDRQVSVSPISRLTAECLLVGSGHGCILPRVATRADPPQGGGGAGASGITDNFPNTGIGAYSDGRMKISADGRALAVSVRGHEDLQRVLLLLIVACLAGIAWKGRSRPNYRAAVARAARVILDLMVSSRSDLRALHGRAFRELHELYRHLLRRCNKIC